jgi:hypothetical protein
MCCRMAAHGRVKQKSKSFEWCVVVRQRSDGDVLDVVGQLGGRFIEWSCNRNDQPMGVVRGGTTGSSGGTWRRVTSSMKVVSMALVQSSP